MWVPLSKFFSTPPNNINKTAFLIYSWPQIEGARELASKSNTPRFLDKVVIFRTSLSVIVGAAIPPPDLVLNKLIWLQRITVL